MLPVPRAVLVFSLVAVATLWCNNLHARGKKVKSGTPEPCGKVCPHSRTEDAKQPCPMRPIWCPDDYCPKCPPCICPPKYCGTCDRYDAKCAPCICPPRYCGTCDCYDAKCPPCIEIPCFFPSFYKCPPPKCCGRSVHQPAIKR
jgi:hypothetical protein